MGTAEGIVTRRGTCPVCGFGCQVVTELHNGQPVRVKPDRTFEVVGERPVVVVDAAGAKTATDGAAAGLRASDLRVHVLRAGSTYHLDRRAVITLRP